MKIGIYIVIAVLTVLTILFFRYDVPILLKHKLCANIEYGFVADDYRNNSRKSDLELLHDPPITVDHALTVSNSRKLRPQIPRCALNCWLRFKCDEGLEFVVEISPSINFEKHVTSSVRLDGNPKYGRIRDKPLVSSSVCKLVRRTSPHQ